MRTREEIMATIGRYKHAEWLNESAEVERYKGGSVLVYHGSTLAILPLGREVVHLAEGWDSSAPKRVCVKYFLATYQLDLGGMQRTGKVEMFEG